MRLEDILKGLALAAVVMLFGSVLIGASIAIVHNVARALT